MSLLRRKRESDEQAGLEVGPTGLDEDAETGARADDEPVAAEGGAGPEAGGAAARALKAEFFELDPDEVRGFEPRGEVIARRRPFDPKPLLKASAAALVVAALVAAAAFLWPSSRAKVPDLVGKTLDIAMREARESNLDPAVTSWRYSNRHSDGVVLAQSLAKGSAVRKGTKLFLTVCKGPPPETGSTAGSSPPQASAQPSAEQVITIDAGHQALPVYGEWIDPGMTRRSSGDPGGKGTISGNLEYEVTIDIALKLKGLLEKDGLSVVMTREANTLDTPNATRAEIANNANSVLSVHIHCGNSGDPATMGICTLCPAENTWTAGFYEKSKTAALYIQEQLVKSCEIDDMGVLATGDLPEFNWSKVPTVEPQIGFLTNPRDDGFLADEQFRWKAAWGLRNGIKKFLENQ